MNPTRGLELLHELGLLKAIFPEVESRVAEWAETLAIVKLLPTRSFTLGMAALLRSESPTAVESVCRRLKLSNAETKRIEWLVANYESIISVPGLSWPRLQRLLITDGIDELLFLAEAMAKVAGKETKPIDECRKALATPTEELNPAPLISGSDLIAIGLKPGPEFQRLLEMVRDEQLEKKLPSKAEALKRVEQLRKKPE
jgi:tRNA nucleotidyltransferase/poly(A) polymerase